MKFEDEFRVVLLPYIILLSGDIFYYLMQILSRSYTIVVFFIYLR